MELVMRFGVGRWRDSEDIAMLGNFEFEATTLEVALVREARL